MNRSSSFVLYLFLISTIITLDQASKKWALINLAGNQDVEINSWFNFSFAANRGITWSLFDSQTSLGLYILIFLISIIILAFTFYAIIQHLNKKPIYFESLVIGGAISNIVDRVSHGFVIDFLDLHIGTWHWATFNIADILVVVGILGILIKGMWKKDD